MPYLSNRMIRAVIYDKAKIKNNMETPRIFEADTQRISLNLGGGVTLTVAGDDTVITPKSVESIEVDDDGDMVLIRHSGGEAVAFFASSVGEASKVASEIAQHFKLGEPVRIQQTAFEAGIIPSSYFLMALLATVFLGIAAFSEGNGRPRAGTAAALKRLVEVLGPTGVLTIGGLLTTGAFCYLCYKLIVRPLKAVYSQT